MTIPVSYAPLAVENPLAKNLIRFREERFGTQEKLADASGFKQSVISKWESGKATPKPKSLLRLARALDLSIEELLAGVDPDYDLIRQPAEYQSSTSQEGTDVVEQPSIDPAILRRVAAVEAGLAQDLEELAAIRQAIEQAIAPTRVEPRARKRG